MSPPGPRLPSEAFQTMVEQSQSAMCVTTAQLDPPGPEIVYANAAFGALTGYDVASLLGSTPRVLQGPLTDRAVLDGLRAALTRREPFEGEAVNYRADGTPFIINWQIEPLFDEGGAVRYFVAFLGDVTEFRQLQRLRRALIAVEQSVVAAVDPATERGGVDHVVEAGAAAIGAMLWSGRVAVLAAKTGEEHTAWRAAYLSPEERDELWQILSSADAHGVRRNSATVALDFPFVGGPATPSGGVVIDRLTEPELALIDCDHVAELVRAIQKGVSVVAGQLREAAEAQELQRVLLPPASPQVAGFELATRYVPSHRSERAGGDWYDALGRNGACVASIGDVAGKGLRAAAEMGLLRAHVRASLDVGLDLEAALRSLHRFCRAEDIVATCVFISLEPSGAWRAVSAGHLPPIVAAPQGSHLVELLPGPPIGAFADYPAVSVAEGKLREGCTLVLYTDGLVEHRQQTIDAGLADLVAAADGSVTPEDLCDRLLTQREQGREDDVAVLAVRPGT